MSQTSFSEFSNYLETNETITEEHLHVLLTTPFKDVILEEVTETAVTLAGAMAKAGFLPEKAQGRARLAVARELLRQCAENHIVFTPAPQTPTVPTPILPTTLTLEMPGTTRCATCSNVLQPGAEFCSRCGTPVASKLVCVKCGMQGGVGETFCLKDGIPLVPLVDALCISELMSGENMSIMEATKTLQEMDTVRRSKLQEKAMRRGGGLFGGSSFLG